jgi:hypothetical protein
VIEYHLEHVFSYRVALRLPPEVIGPVPEGIRINVYVDGGEVSGPRVLGKVLPVGADWMTVRADGLGIIDVRMTLEAEDGALVYLSSSGTMDLGENGYQRLLGGELPSDGTALRSSPRFQSAHPDYRWLNRLACIGIGELFLSRAEVRYDVYALH